MELLVYLCVVCDTFSHEDYPVFVEVGEDPREIAGTYDGQNMQQIMEVYNLHLDKDMQMAESRAFHF